LNNGSVDKRVSDTILVSRAKSGDSKALSALIEKYSENIRIKAYTFNCVHVKDNEDLYQEGMMGFVSAVYYYDENRGASFNTFMTRVVSNRMIQAYNRMRDYSKVFLLTENSSEKFLNSVDNGTMSPEEQLVSDECYEEYLAFIETEFSNFEKKVYKLFLKNLSYNEMSIILECSVKSIDNALQRIKKKIRDFFEKQGN
jgi:RNA polymerase sporulation-specific sigma factor